jgi:hypothetical protein
VLDDAHLIASGVEAESLLGLISATVPAVSYVLSGRWDPSYRYHTLLRSYLNAEGARSDLIRQRELHRTTAAWAERNGLPEEAMSHATQAEDWPVLTRLLGDHGLSLLLRGRGFAVRAATDALPPESRLDTDILRGSRSGTTMAPGRHPRRPQRHVVVREGVRDRLEPPPSTIRSQRRPAAPISQSED